MPRSNILLYVNTNVNPAKIKLVAGKSTVLPGYGPRRVYGIHSGIVQHTITMEYLLELIRIISPA
eukprot:SAG11_NODE_21524_length_423_cov_2.206790_1_plen_64_part_01